MKNDAAFLLEQAVPDIDYEDFPPIVTKKAQPNQEDSKADGDEDDGEEEEAHGSNAKAVVPGRTTSLFSNRKRTMVISSVRPRTMSCVCVC